MAVPQLFVFTKHRPVFCGTFKNPFPLFFSFLNKGKKKAFSLSCEDSGFWKWITPISGNILTGRKQRCECEGNIDICHFYLVPFITHTLYPYGNKLDDFPKVPI